MLEDAPFHPAKRCFQRVNSVDRSNRTSESVGEWVCFVPYLRFGLTNQQPAGSNGRLLRQCPQGFHFIDEQCFTAFESTLLFRTLYERYPAFVPVADLRDAKTEFVSDLDYFPFCDDIAIDF